MASRRTYFVTGEVIHDAYNHPEGDHVILISVKHLEKYHPSESRRNTPMLFPQTVRSGMLGLQGLGLLINGAVKPWYI